VVLKSVLSKSIARCRAKVTLQDAIGSRVGVRQLEKLQYKVTMNMSCTYIKWKFCLLNFYPGRLGAFLLGLSERGVVHNPSL